MYWIEILGKKICTLLRELGPINVFFVLLLSHLVLINGSKINLERINTFTSIIFQMVGGYMVLWGIFINFKNLKNNILKFFRIFLPKTDHLEAQDIVTGQPTIGSPSLGLQPKMEKIESILEEVKNLQNLVHKNKREIKKIEKSLENKLRVHQHHVKQLDEKVEKAFHDGARYQISGTLCLMYGLAIQLYLVSF